MAKSRRDNVIQEILTSEVTYNNGLQMVDQLVTTHLRQNIDSQHLIFDSPEIMRLFDLLSQVRMVSTTLNAELGAFFANGCVGSVSHALENFPRVIIIYFSYIQCYHTVNPLLASARQTNKAVAQFFEHRESLLGAPVDTFLITPVQRPPRYRLLFQELLKSTAPDSEDYAMLQRSVAKISEEVGKLDQAIDELREANALVELASRMTNFQVFAHQRRLLFQGEALKFSRKRTEDRYFVLFSDALVVAEPGLLNSLKLNKLYGSGEYLISDVVDCPPFVNALDVRQKAKSFRANMRSPADKQAMLDGFERMKQIQKVDQIDLERRGFAPVWIPDDQAPVCMACGAKFTFVVRRHHCRSCGNCICKGCFSQKAAIPGLDGGPQPVCTKCFGRIAAMT
jgi:hypothetical protein